MENENASPEPLDYIRISKYNHGIIMGYTAPVNRKGIFSMHNSKKDSVRFFIQFALLAAIEAVFCFTPLGSLPAIGPIVATLAMIPVIITSILLGTKAGTLMGAITGLFSFIVWTFTPPAPIAAFVFSPFYTLGEYQGNFFSIVICFLPRILVGTVSGVLYNALGKSMKNNVMAMVIASVVGSLVNTFGVMLGIWAFFGDQYASIAGQGILLIIGSTVLTNGVPEAIVAGVLCPAICKPVKKFILKD